MREGVNYVGGFYRESQDLSIIEGTKLEKRCLSLFRRRCNLGILLTLAPLFP